MLIGRSSGRDAIQSADPSAGADVSYSRYGKNSTNDAAASAAARRIDMEMRRIFMRVRREVDVGDIIYTGMCGWCGWVVSV